MKKNDPEFSRQAVPMGNRNNFWKILSVMLGMTFFSASMLAGGELGLGLTFTHQAKPVSTSTQKKKSPLQDRQVMGH